MAMKNSESESPKRIRAKLKRYWQLFEDSNVPRWPEYLYERDEQGQVIRDEVEVGGRVILDARRWFPEVLWFAQDEYRQRQLQNIVREGKLEAQCLFRVLQFEELAQLFDCPQL